jgi:hypothetical protein
MLRDRSPKGSKVNSASKGKSSTKKNTPDAEDDVFARTDKDGNTSGSSASKSKGVGRSMVEVAGTIGAALGAVFLALKLLPQAVADAYFGWLPEEARAPASSSCCCSCLFISLMAALAALGGYIK